VFTTYLFAFEVTAALLVIAVVGAVVLSRRSGSAGGEAEEEPVKGAEPVGGPVAGDEEGGPTPTGDLSSSVSVPESEEARR
jgi:hypothetical protein